MLPLKHQNNFIYLPINHVSLLINDYTLVIFKISKLYKLMYILSNNKKNFYIKNNIFENRYWKQFIFYVITYWEKIVFKGKGYRIRCFKKNKKFTFNFGRSHWTKIKLKYNWYLFRFARQKFYISTVGYLNFLEFKKCLRNIKKPNRYTLRGLRFKKQIIRRRFGKISQYISSLH